MNQIIEEKISKIKRFLKTDLSSIQYLDYIELSENSYKSLLYPTDDLFLYKHQYDSIMALAKENDRIFMFQVDDLETIYDVSKPFEYESYREINLYSISVIFPESVDWLVIIDEELDFGIGVFVSSLDKKAEYEKAYSEHYNDLLTFIKSELNNPRKKGSDYFHLNNVISILQTKKKVKEIVLEENDFTLTALIPDEKAYAEDEVEIWLHGADQDLCLFKDSCQYVLQAECNSVVQSIHTQPIVSGESISENFVSLCLDKSDETIVDQYRLFSFPDRETWLLPTSDPDTLQIEVWDIEPFQDEPICQKLCGFSVDKAKFTDWWNRVLRIYC